MGPCGSCFLSLTEFFLGQRVERCFLSETGERMWKVHFTNPISFFNAPETIPNMLKQTLNHCFLWVLHIRGWEYSFAVASFFLQFLHNSERPKHAKTEVINPDTTYQIAWQILTSACMAFVAIVTPIQVLWIMWIGKIRE